jgi:hypothetical protein
MLLSLLRESYNLFWTGAAHRTNGAKVKSLAASCEASSIPKEEEF